MNPVRQLFLDAIPLDLFAINLPELRYLYIPNAHFRALHPDNMLVEGIRGAGKSLWWSALQDKAHRELIAAVLPRTQLSKVDCSAGFGTRKSLSYPSSMVLQQLQEQFNTFDIWYSIVAWNLLSSEIDMPDTWGKRIAWIQANLEHIESSLLRKDRELQAQDKIQLVLFDALDRAAQDWQALRNLLKGLLRLLLEFRAYRAIRLKAFIRPDMLEDKTVLAFPDSSKIIQNKVSLEWQRADLYSLLWHYLGNEPQQGKKFRDSCQKYFGQNWQEPRPDIWQAPDAMRADEALQRKIFHALAGEWMGRDARRGFPYTWLPNHLGDSYAKVSPRSFLAALRVAASDDLRKEQKYPLHYEAIKKGVQQASSIRVDELREDYPWVGELLNPLKGITLPCEFCLITEYWRIQDSLSKLTQTGEDARRLPARLDEGNEGVKQDLVELGIFQEKRDGRIDMPDVYRVGYGLGRRGGIKPVR
ncbi:hypothetical protein [Candidatus Venteria ishoeyi]|uniref:Uncharacterized protein n=1 Tax=Candidatus Venteria ishoeyi TaxID=1899563 RepID=A0A1H6FGS0_9GAMM|nr:hypothetical protein [Candidatus Venteria ishoeyi]SEH09242.1 Uncharacterised protein [Candidatus Venteria ishoeyi]